MTDSEKNKAFLFQNGFSEDFLDGTFEAYGVVITQEQVLQMVHVAFKEMVTKLIQSRK